MIIKTFQTLVSILVFASLPSIANANVIYQDLHLIPQFAKVHGIVMGVAFVIVFPLGSLLIRALRTKGSTWIHATWQLLGWVLMVAGLATGIRLGKIINLLHNNTHTILGTVIVVLMLIQPFIGFVHHRRFLATQQHGTWTHVHVWFGRTLILLGIINGGLGLQLAGNTKAGTIVYGVVAGLVGAACFSMVVFVEARKRNQQVDARETSSETGAEERSKKCTP
ncbi:hypothetical protein AJ79_10017 [Helicocarpus griseus UAMH5409]|uniref:Cytochrome b561 domain-containing protein n=1 Tax=Helicocarpus griseus UAMH5409 TaxID=1447875 RepID=A0A2B7WFR6_9EURO|nr:hypothetical protein AJ79_10017 [Helicocarpus griseus UAMH5409]